MCIYFNIKCFLLSCLITFVVSIQSCDMNALIVRYVEHDGFHRELVTTIEIYGRTELNNCTILLLESLPSGIYVNADQLADLQRMGELSACSLDFVDVEQPMHKSKPIDVLVYSLLKSIDDDMTTKLRLPVHLRYQEPNEEGQCSSVYIPPPTVLLHCPSLVHCDDIHAPCELCSVQRCTWQELPYTTNTDKLVLQLPVGTLSRLWFVISVTFAVTIGGSFFILKELWIVRQMQMSLR